MKFFLRIIKYIVFATMVLGIPWFLLTRADNPKQIEYGISFNTLYATELGLDWEEVYTAILEDLGVKRVRLAAHWPMISPEEDEWNFKELDKQVELAQKNNVEIILAIGRRLPRWPECHVPDWAKEKSWEEQQEYILEYLTIVVNRYKDNPYIKYWQIENEPFLTVYAKKECGDLDKDFLDREIAHVKKLDPTRDILVTDSGNLGTWVGAYRRGDVFGTSVYVYLWDKTTGPIRTILPPKMYIAKRNLMKLLFGDKKTILIELSVEPWLNLPVVETDLETQLTRMNIDKFEDIIEYAKDTKLDTQYLWGAEWWYWLKETQNHPEFWERAKNLYRKEGT